MDLRLETKEVMILFLVSANSSYGSVHTLDKVLTVRSLL